MRSPDTDSIITSIIIIIITTVCRRRRRRLTTAAAAVVVVVGLETTTAFTLAEVSTTRRRLRTGTAVVGTVDADTVGPVVTVDAGITIIKTPVVVGTAGVVTVDVSGAAAGGLEEDEGSNARRRNLHLRLRTRQRLNDASTQET